MGLKTKKMNLEPCNSDGSRICVMRDVRSYNRQLKPFQEKFKRPMYDFHLKNLAPSSELLSSYKRGIISWKDYIPIFKEEVLDTQSDLIRMLAFYALVNNITFLCTEGTPDKCHRRLLAEECKKYQPNLSLVIQ